jgi:hypothetical protein
MTEKVLATLDRAHVASPRTLDVLSKGSLVIALISVAASALVALWVPLSALVVLGLLIVSQIPANGQTRRAQRTVWFILGVAGAISVLTTLIAPGALIPLVVVWASYTCGRLALLMMMRHGQLVCPMPNR